jgi:hypothetical protein
MKFVLDSEHREVNCSQGRVLAVVISIAWFGLVLISRQEKESTVAWILPA